MLYTSQCVLYTTHRMLYKFRRMLYTARCVRYKSRCVRYKTVTILNKTTQNETQKITNDTSAKGGCVALGDICVFRSGRGIKFCVLYATQIRRCFSLFAKKKARECLILVCYIRRNDFLHSERILNIFA